MKCGSKLDKGYFNYENRKMICYNCFNHLYWNNVLNDPKTIIINGIAYCYTDNPKDGGYDGREFLVNIKNEGVKKVGLWLNGEIPEFYNKEDNAEFID